MSTFESVQRPALMPTALSRTRLTAFAHSSAVVTSSNTNVNSADELDCPTKKPASSGAPSSREMLCTVLTIHAMFCSLLRVGSLLGFAYQSRALSPNQTTAPRLATHGASPISQG